jgi:hypothetical protein
VKKRHHTIPQCYLEGFTDENGHVWVLDTKNKIFNTQPVNILVESHFYRITLKNGEKSVVVEDTLANIEGAYATIYKNKLSQDKFLTEEERVKVSIFFAAMMQRTRPNRDGMRRMFENMKRSMEEWREQLKTISPEQRKILEATPSSGGMSISTEEPEEGLGDFSEHHSANLISQIIHVAQIIFNMKWSVWKYPEGEGTFVTSDDPLVIMRPASIKKYGKDVFGSLPGLLFKDAEITLPLSKDRLLLAGWILNEDSYTEIPSKIAENINQRTILHSSERILASSKTKLEEIKVKYPSKTA